MDETKVETELASEEPKKTNKERLKEITDSIEAGIKDLFSSEKYKNYLRTMSKFHNYSFNNTMLIHMQMPEATRVASYNKWKDKFHRTVKRGEHGIKIIAPTPYIKKVEEMKRDPDTHAPLVDANGEVIMEEKQIKIPRFKVVTVFDVSQTFGRPLPQLASTLSGDVKQFDIFMQALKRSAPVPIETQTMSSNMDGYFNSSEQRIVIREGMSEVQTICAAVHEIAHSILHNNKGKTEDQKSQRTQEVEAESIAYAVCAYYGIETGENSFGYLASWSSGQDLKELKASLETINNTAGKLINDIDRNFSLISKERGIDLAVKQSEAEDALVPLPLDEYPMPDSTVDPNQFEVSGVANGDLIPVSRSCAIEFLDSNFPVYSVANGEVLLCMDTTEIEKLPPDVMFGIDRDEWEQSQLFQFTIANRLSHQPEREAAFISHPDSFAIYQMNRSSDSSHMRFSSYDELMASGVTPSRDMYDLIYTAELGTKSLDDIFYEFNEARPADYRSYSLSASDIIALNQGGDVSYHYVDRVGFKELPDFAKENPLRNAEMSIEDDYNMVDGIINNGSKQPTVAELEERAKHEPISLMDLADAVHRENNPSIESDDLNPKRKSIYEQLRQPVQQATAPKRAKRGDPER